MKKAFLAAAAVLPLVSASVFAADVPSPAQSQTGIAAEMWGGMQIVGSSSGDADDGVDESFGIIGGKVSFMSGMDNGGLMQLSIEGMQGLLSKAAADDDQVRAAPQGTLHLLLGESGIGAFGGGGVIDLWADDTASFYFAGLEHRASYDSGRMLMQLGYLDSSAVEGDVTTIHDAVFVRLAPSFDMGDNTSLNLQAAYVNGKDDDGRGHIISWGAGITHHLESMPGAALFVDYVGTGMISSESRTDEHQIMLGLRFELGGVASEEIDSPDAYRWVGVSQRAD